MGDGEWQEEVDKKKYKKKKQAECNRKPSHNRINLPSQSIITLLPKVMSMEIPQLLVIGI
jgi:hypothetical protein